MEDDQFFSSNSLPMASSNPDPSSICKNCWAVAEETTQEVVNRIHPTLDSEEKRKDVIDYVQRLVRTSLVCEVFPYGSVPLKTYLPDGDIDLTTLSSPNIEERLAFDVLAVLRAEELNEDAEYEVKDTQFIDAEKNISFLVIPPLLILLLSSLPKKIGFVSFDGDGDGNGNGLCLRLRLRLLSQSLYFLNFFASTGRAEFQVKLVKCLVQNIVIDISFNQLGGLCTLCFLEQVDRLVGKNHLFKRSIILIKAWCYYESRILGAHHGLISTYALETLVLYIFNLFHSSLDGPLAVLYRFLDYFSKFDWEDYCISLNGPVLKSSLSDIAVELPVKGQDDLMLSEEFQRNCLDMYSVPSRGLDTSLRSFSQKHLNIIDPLKENNNLGRSVNRGNFYRIRSAFKYGARKLGKILLLPGERIAGEIKMFFANTLERHGCKDGADIQSSALPFGVKWSSNLSSSSHAETLSEDEMQPKSSNDDFSDNNLGVEHKCTSVLINGLDRCLTRLDRSQIMSESSCSTDGTAVSGCRGAGDANGLATPRPLSLRSSNDTTDCSPISSNFNSSLSGQFYDASHFYFSRVSTENGNFENGILCQKRPSDFVDEKMGYHSWMEQGENHLEASHTVCSCANNHEGLSSSGSAISSLDINSLESLSLDFREMGLGGDMETLNPLADLSGDHDSHIRSLLYGQSCHGYALSAAPGMPSPPTSPSQFSNKRPLDTVRQTRPLKQNSCLSTDRVALGPPVYPANKSTLFNATFGSIEKHTERGTGTYLPTMNLFSGRERSSQGKRRYRATGTHSQVRRHTHINGVAPALPEKNSIQVDSQDISCVRSPVQGHGKSGLSHQSHQSNVGNTHANGFSNLALRIEFGSLGQLADGNSQLSSRTSQAWASTSNPVVPEVQTSKPVLKKKEERVAEGSYYLKNEDFPPLSS
ncbi:unnamed protein product [Ilex paraguariensis]|uniref:PAP/OAS1 substrate-binding-related domain-containing protein n=1 Tax=Ilex paraguariensis TaxID=185542 RepID=A0ABC8T7Y8_9AQUA